MSHAQFLTTVSGSEGLSPFIEGVNVNQNIVPFLSKPKPSFKLFPKIFMEYKIVLGMSFKLLISNSKEIFG